MERVSFQITKLHLDQKLAKYVSIGPVNQKLNVMHKWRKSMKNVYGYRWECSGTQSVEFPWVSRLSNNRVPSQMWGLSIIMI